MTVHPVVIKRPSSDGARARTASVVPLPEPLQRVLISRPWVRADVAPVRSDRSPAAAARDEFVTGDRRAA